jgi:hypothetical protein
MNTRQDGKQELNKINGNEFINPIPCIPFPLIRGRGKMFFRGA